MHNKYTARVSGIAIILGFMFIAAIQPVRAASLPSLNLSDIWTALTTLKSVHYDSTIALQLLSTNSQSQSSSKINGTVSSNGDLSINTLFPASQTSNAISISIASQYAGKAQPIETGALQFDTKLTNGDFYAFLKNFSLTPDSGEIDAAIAAYENVWIKFDKSTASNYIGTKNVQAIASETPTQRIQELQTAGVVKIVALKDYQIINSINAHHYVLIINKTNLAAYYYANYKKVYGKTIPATLKTQFAKDIAAINFNSIDLWIDDSTHLPVKFSVITTQNITSGKDTSKLTLNAQLGLSNFNVPVTIQAPSIFKTFNDFMNQKMGVGNASNGTVDPSYTSPVRQKGNDAKVKYLLSNLRAVAELHYSNTNNSYSGLCTDTIAVKSFNDITTTAGETPTCTVDYLGQQYAISGKTSTAYFCVDSTGIAKDTSSKLNTSASSCN